MTQKSRNTIDR